MQITEEAVEAAWATVWDVPHRPTSDISRNEMRLALEAAAPHMFAEWEECRKREAFESLRRIDEQLEATDTTSPYRSQA